MSEAARLAVRIGMPANSTIATGSWSVSENSGKLVVEVAVDDERQAQRQDEPEEQALLAAEAVGGQQQRAVDRDAEPARGGDARPAGESGGECLMKSRER